MTVTSPGSWLSSSRPIVACPAMTFGSLYGEMNNAPGDAPISNRALFRGFVVASVLDQLDRIGPERLDLGR